MALPSNVGKGTARGLFIDSFGNPIKGKIRFIPSPSKLLNTAATPVPVTILPRPVTVTLDNAGSFTEQLVATNDPDNNPVGWTYLVTFELEDVTVLPFSIEVPENAVVDLAVASPVPDSDGVPIVRGPKGDDGSIGQVNLDVLMDVVVSNPATGHVLRYNGTEWVNVLGTTHFAAAVHGHAVAAITDSGTTGRAAVQAPNAAALTALLIAAAEGTFGVIPIATQAEVTAGLTDAKAVTPLKLAQRFAALVGAAPATLDQINEIATALGNDPNFATTIMTALAGKQAADADLSAIAALASVADRMLYATGPNTWALTTLTAQARTLMAASDAINQRNVLDVYSRAEGQLSGTVVSSAAPTPSGSAKSNFYTVTALAVNATFAAPSGTPTDGNGLIIRIKDNGTARTLAWASAYNALSGATLPSTTVAGKDMYIAAVYNAASSKWDVAYVGNGV